MPEVIYKQESYKIIGACFEVHRELGCGFLEDVYHEALRVEFRTQGIPFEHEKKCPVYYKDTQLDKSYYADFVCYDHIIIEIKALSALCSRHEAQVLNYLKATRLRLGVLVNFGAETLSYKRLVK
jgi:GxxExxY protein